MVTVTFLTLAFAQLWHVFNMRHRRSGLLRNEVTGNVWVWASLLLCSALLVIPAYLPPFAHLLQLATPDRGMWLIVLAMSLAPVVVVQGATVLIGRNRAGPSS